MRAFFAKLSTAFVWLRPFAGRVDVNATGNSVAAARDIRDSTIQIGLNEQQTTELVQRAQHPLVAGFNDLAAQIAREKGIDAAPLQAILAKLGEGQVPPDDVTEKLNAAADRFIELRAELENQGQDEISNLRREALGFINEGKFELAMSALNKGRLKAHANRTRGAADEATFFADQAGIDEIQFRYQTAAEKYGNAAALVSDNPPLSFQYLAKQAKAIQLHGEEFVDKNALLSAIDLWQTAMRLRPFEVAQDDYLKAQNNLSSAIYALGVRESGNERLWQAASMNREALELVDKGEQPRVWGAAQSNLGSALLIIGERNGGTREVWNSLAALKEALKVISRDTEPANWAGVHNNIGNALKLIAERERDEGKFGEAAEAYRAALTALTSKDMNAQRAMTLSNLAVSFTDLGALQNRAEPFQQAVAALRDVLPLYPKDQYPVHWARVQSNIGSAFNHLGAVSYDVAVFQQGRCACREALTVFTRENAPLDWAFNMWGVGISTKKIAESTRDISEVEAAVSALSSAHEVISASDDDRAKPRIKAALDEAIGFRAALK